MSKKHKICFICVVVVAITCLVGIWTELFLRIKPMNVIESDNFRITIPEKYKVIRHDVYKEQSEFFNNIDLLKEGNEEIVDFVKSHPPDLEIHKGSYTYEIKMRRYFLTFYTLVGEGKPEDIEDFAASQTRSRSKPKADDIEINGIKGKIMGSSHWAAWLKKENCMAYLSFQGLGELSDEIKEDASNILNSLEYIP